MSILRSKQPLFSNPPIKNPNFPIRSKPSLSIPNRTTRSLIALPNASFNSIPCRIFPITRANNAQTPPLSQAPDSEILFTQTFPLKRIKTVEGKVTVRLDRLEREGSKWNLVVGCDLEGKWVLHWGVTYCDDLGNVNSVKNEHKRETTWARGRQ